LRTARVASAAASEPAPGSESENAAVISPRRQTRKIAPLLLGAAGGDDRPASGVLDEIDGGGRRARPGDFFDGEAERQGAHVGPAVGFGDVEPHEPLIAQKLQLFLGIGFGLVHLGGARRDAVARDRAHQVAHLALLRRQVEVVARHRKPVRVRYSAYACAQVAPLTILVTLVNEIL
jgi:hypothetical protein